MESAPQILIKRREAWASKEILRRLYGKWYGLISESLRPGKVLELGGGSGPSKEFLPDAIRSDIVFAPWLDAVLDAHALPFKDGSLGNIILFDVLHHLARPTQFFFEAKRVLKRQGRIILMEPYVSWASFFVYRFLHAEGMVWRTDPFEPYGSGEEKDPFTGNQAIPTLIFQKYRARFTKAFPGLEMIREEWIDSLVYPLSGGFNKPSLCPVSLYPLLNFTEKVLRPLRRFLAFRMLLVLEKTCIHGSDAPI